MLLSYSHAFLVAAAEHAAAAKQEGVDGEVDGMMCAIALQNAVVGATRLLGRSHPAVTACLAETRDLKDVRDMLTHFDDYALGTGTLQKSLSEGDGAYGWMPVWNSPETLVILARRAGEDDATHYDVAIHDALRSVAVLIGAAAASLNAGPSALVERLTAAD